MVIFGPNFPQRTVAAELLVGEEIAQRISIGHKHKSVEGYFFQIPPDGVIKRVRHSNCLEGELQERFSLERIHPLEKEYERGG